MEGAPEGGHPREGKGKGLSAQKEAIIARPAYSPAAARAIWLHHQQPESSGHRVDVEDELGRSRAIGSLWAGRGAGPPTESVILEIPEAAVLSRQIAKALDGREIRNVTVLQTPHKLTWFHGNPEDYPARLTGKRVTGARPHGGVVEICLGKASLLFNEGPSLRHVTASSTLPKKHQLLLEFDDDTFLSVNIRMYGGIAYFEESTWNNEFYEKARDKPSPLGRSFSRRYFTELCKVEGSGKMSAKHLLATEQRVPGLGNGVLQDILFHAAIHPKRKMETLSTDELGQLFCSIKTTLKAMVKDGGRDTETDLFGEPGGYVTILSRKTVGTPCPQCGDSITKAAYAGGSVYFCSGCQPLH